MCVWRRGGARGARSHHALLQRGQVLAHLPQQQAQLVGRHVELLPGLVALLAPLLGLELRPQALQGGQLGLAITQLLLQTLPPGKASKQKVFLTHFKIQSEMQSAVQYNNKRRH